MQPSVEESHLKHFWRVGFEGGFSPSPRFETDFSKPQLPATEDTTRSAALSSIFATPMQIRR